MATSITPTVLSLVFSANAALFKGILNAIPNILKILWPLLLFMALFVLIKFSFSLYRYRILSRAGMREVDKMNGTDFEVFLTSLFSRLGYKAEHVGHTGDYGVDVVAEREGKKFAIQAKCYGFKGRAGEDAVREAFGGINIYNCTNAIVVTNRFFTPKAKQLAKSDNVELWDRYALAKAIILANKLNPK